MALDNGPEFYLEFLFEYFGYELAAAVHECNLTRVKQILSNDLKKLVQDEAAVQSTIVVSNQLLLQAFQPSFSVFKHCTSLDSPLHIAVRNVKNQTKSDHGSFQCVTILLEAAKTDYAKTIDVNEMSFRSWLSATFMSAGLNNETPLHYAARSNNEDLCCLLNMFGFDLGHKSSIGQYPHELCTDEGLKQSLTQIFEQSQAKLRRSRSIQLLLEACKSGDLDVVRSILEENEDLVDCKDTEGRSSTPLHFSAGYNRFVFFFLSHIKITEIIIY